MAGALRRGWQLLDAAGAWPDRPAPDRVADGRGSFSAAPARRAFERQAHLQPEAAQPLPSPFAAAANRPPRSDRQSLRAVDVDALCRSTPGPAGALRRLG